MKYVKSYKYEKYMNRIMGPNPLKLLEELMIKNKTPRGATVLDLGSGMGLTSVFLVREYGFRVYAADLWSDPDEIYSFFEAQGLTKEQITPVHADAMRLPFEKELFDAVVSVDSYNYFGRDIDYLDERLIPFVKKGGYIYIVVPGMKKDCHGNLPPELLLSWTPQQLDYIHDAEYWKNIVSHSKCTEIISVCEMQSNKECWEDWLRCENEYAAGDRKAMENGAGAYLNFIEIILKKN